MNLFVACFARWNVLIYKKYIENSWEKKKAPQSDAF